MIEESKLKPSFIMSHSTKVISTIEKEKLLENYLGAQSTFKVQYTMHRKGQSLFEILLMIQTPYLGSSRTWSSTAQTSGVHAWHVSSCGSLGLFARSKSNSAYIRRRRALSTGGHRAS